MIIKEIAKFWIAVYFSFKRKYDNTALKSGVKERRGIVKLNSEFEIAFKKSSAEITPMIINRQLGIK